MSGRRTLIAAMSVLISVCMVEIAAAGAISKYDPSVLSFMCRVQGGTYSPPSTECNGCFYCLFPDGTLITCDGAGTCSTTKEIKIDSYNLLGAITKNQLALKEPANPDLVALPPPASTPTPEGFCRRNDQGQLLLKIYNQGGAAAVASKTRIVFGSATPVDFDTPAIAAGTGADLVINIPTSCFDANTLRGSFLIGVDATNGVVEANETNNNALGECGPQFQ
jgi:hypothetical protein